MRFLHANVGDDCEQEGWCSSGAEGAMGTSDDARLGLQQWKKLTISCYRPSHFFKSRRYLIFWLLFAVADRTGCTSELSCHVLASYQCVRVGVQRNGSKQERAQAPVEGGSNGSAGSGSVGVIILVIKCSLGIRCPGGSKGFPTAGRGNGARHCAPLTELRKGDVPK